MISLDQRSTGSWSCIAAFAACAWMSGSMVDAGEAPPNAIVSSEFLYEQASFPSCHASTLAELSGGGLIAAWFGGSDEGNDDVGIWVARQEDKGWSKPTEVATGVVGDKRHPCWNPVLFQPAEGPLLLFYKVGPSPSTWWGMLMRSADRGKSWSRGERLPNGILGPIKNKPVALEQGTLLCPSSSEHDGWRVHMESTPDAGKTWTKTEALNDGKEFGAIQPTVLNWPGPDIQLLCRSRQKLIAEVWSRDGGQTWGPMRATALPNPSAGLDGVMLQDGRAALVYNHTSNGRSPLNVAVSKDGKEWEAGVVLEREPGEYSYPAVIQSRDGKVHVTYTWKRERIKHAVLDPAKLKGLPIRQGKWPES